MLKTKLTGEEIPSSDTKIVEWLENRKFNDTGHNMVIGIENRKSTVYRIIEITGYSDFVDVMEFISHLGLVDITDIPYAPKKGYDGRFRYPDLIYLSENSHRIVTRPQ